MKFAYDSIQVNEIQREKIQEIRNQFSAISQALSEIAPSGRYLSIVETHLETAQMFAVKAITHQAGKYDEK